MRDQNFIDGSLFEWAEGLRLAGNRAAHDIDAEVSRQDARDVAEFTDALIEYVVVYRDWFEQLKARQNPPKRIPSSPDESTCAGFAVATNSTRRPVLTTRTLKWSAQFESRPSPTGGRIYAQRAVYPVR